MRRLSLAMALALALPASLEAQSLRAAIENMFKFGGGCDQPVCLSVDGTHGDHYNPAVRSGSANLIGFLTNMISISASSFPISSASSGAVWGKSPEGLPIRTQTSAGPVFGERASTLGKGRLLIGANVSSFNFSSIRGLPLDDLVFNFTHSDQPPAGLGDPVFENDYIEVRTRLDLSLTAATAFVTYGLGNKVDVSVAVPVIHSSMTGTSVAQIISYTNPTPHYFGTAQNPLLRVQTAASGTATGIGDIAARVKIGLPDWGRVNLAFLADARFATGNEDDFLGSGHSSYRALAIASARYGAFSPHANVGYAVRGGEFQNDAVLATLGFDHLLSPSVTLGVDAITEWAVGAEKLPLPAPVILSPPVGISQGVRTVDLTNIPDRRDHVILGSLGAKFSTRSGITLVTNLLVPVRYGGLQPNIAWTAGAEWSF